MEKQARNFKKTIAIFTVLCVMFTLVPMNVFAAETTTTKFASDISGHWAKDTIQRWMDQGSIKGYEDGTFRPDNNISRAEFMSLVNEIFNCEAVGTSAFSDVKSTDWFAGAVAKAYAAGYITGYPDGTMKPGNPITREEAASIIAIIKKLPANPDASQEFLDAGSLDWSKGAVGAAYAAGIMNGYQDQTFRGQMNIKRGEAVVALDKAMRYTTKDLEYTKAGTYGPNTGVMQVAGNVSVFEHGTTLQNMIIAGNLIIDKNVGEGNVSLKNVTVEGETLIYGGGENSVIVIDSSLGKVTVYKENGKIRILISGSTTIQSVTANSGVKLEEEALTPGNEGFNEIVMDAEDGDVILLIGTFDEIEINSPGLEIQMPKETVVNTLILNEKAKITGVGIVNNADVNVSGITFETPPVKINVASGMTAPKILGSLPTTSNGSTGGSSESVSVSVITVTGASDSTTVVNGETLQMSATVTPTNATNKIIAWSVANGSGSATIDSATGLLTATGIGAVTVTATNVASGTTGTKVITVTASIDDNLGAAKDAEALLTAADYVDYSAVTAALVLAETNDAEKIAKTAAINDAIAGLVTLTDVIAADLQTAKDAEALLTAADYVDYSAVTAALALAETNDAEKITKTVAINDAIAGLVTVIDAIAADIQAAKDAEALLTAADYVDYSAVTAALALAETNDAEKIAKTAAINDAIAGLVTVIDSDLQAAKDAEALLTGADYVDYSAVTTALALTEANDAEKIAKTAAINDAITGLVTVTDAIAADLQAAKDAEALLSAADYVDYSAVTAALALAETNDAEKTAKTAAINDAIAGLLTVIDADLQAVKDAEALLTAADYVDYSAVTAALALAETNDAEKMAKTIAISDAISGLEIIILVSTAEDLNNVRNNLDGYYKQTADIDLQDIPWTKIGEYSNNFRGSYNGNGFKISNLSIAIDDHNVGLFGTISGSIENVTIENASISAVSRVGALVGRLMPSGIIKNSHLTGIVIIDGGSMCIGGLVGESDGTIDECSVSGDTIIVGTGDAGGLVGRNGGTIKKSFATVEVEGVYGVGGLVGLNYSTGSHGTIIQSYATGNTTAIDTGFWAGGLVGDNRYSDCLISESYATGKVVGASSGGLIGLLDNGVVEKSYYDQNTTQQSDIGKGIPKLTAEMMQQETFSNWDFIDTWTISQGVTYPTFR